MKKGIDGKYRNCLIHNAGWIYVVTNEKGRSIGTAPTQASCKDLIDQYWERKEEK